MSKLMIYGMALTVLLGGVGAVADALVVTEREELEQFAESVTGEVSGHRIDAALRYASPASEAVEVLTVDGRWSFDERNQSRLAQKARSALAPLDETKLRVVQQSLHLDGDHGRVALRLHTSLGLVNVVFSLNRHDDRWLVRRVVVS